MAAKAEEMTAAGSVKYLQPMATLDLCVASCVCKGVLKLDALPVSLLHAQRSLRGKRV